MFVSPEAIVTKRLHISVSMFVVSQVEIEARSDTFCFLLSPVFGNWDYLMAPSKILSALDS